MKSRDDKRDGFVFRCECGLELCLPEDCDEVECERCGMEAHCEMRLFDPFGSGQTLAAVMGVTRRRVH